ncbi:putative G-protein coupled receptor [Apostichopus japonicus]|uniref:Kisspeptin receptor n=1 Tax=Stichopus japonicus TaxID=307972 RepID=A0A2G8KIK8_STIJA|nr:putative G-protein coupled receptor [Apostichopus japonicus]QBE90573.1 kisspeptin receptor [Apostichopus japonicus]
MFDEMFLGPSSLANSENFDDRIRRDIWTDFENSSYVYTHNNETLRELRVFTGRAEFYFGVLYSLIALIGIIANLLIFVKMCVSSILRTPSNYFITNLAMSDLLVLVALLTTRVITMYTVGYYQNIILIFFIQYLQHVCVQATAFVLAAMSYTRYQFIIHPLKARAEWTSARVWWICGATWIISAILYVPILFGVLHVTGDTVTSFVPIPLRRKMFSSLRLLPMLIIPGGIILISYAKIIATNRKRNTFLRRKSMVTANGTLQKNAETQSKKLTKMVIIIVLVFFIGWGPYQIYLSALDLRPYFLQKTPLRWRFVVISLGVLRLLAYLGCTINPFIYAHTNPAFLTIRRTKKKSILPKTNTTALSTPRNSCQIEQNRIV